MTNVELVKSIYEGKVELMKQLADEFEWHEMEGFPYGGIYRTVPSLVEGVFAKIGQDWDNFNASADSVEAVGEDSVLALGAYSGVSKRSGNTMHVAFAHVYKLQAGKIIIFRQYADSAKFIAALG